MAIKRPNVSFKTRNDVFDSITPNCVVQPEVAVPAGEWKPARYLPVQWTGEASKDGFIISKGKIVCFDNAGRIADMFLKATCAAAAAVGDQIVAYDATDAEFGVHNVATGETCAAGDIVTLADLSDGLLAQGLVVIGRDVAATDFTNATSYDNTQAADCQLVCDAFWSEPIGVAAYDVYAWAGDAPQELVYTNYQKQHLIQFFTEVQMRAPLVVAASTTQVAVSANVAASTFVAGAAGDHIEGATLVGLARYDHLTNGGSIVAIILDSAGIAQNTDRTPLATSVTTGLVNQKSDPELIFAAGDYYIDAEAGLVIVHSSTGNLAGSQFSAADTIDYFPLAGASTQHKYVHAVGPVRPGDALTYDAYSNFKKAAAGETVVAKVLAIEVQPKGLLDRVSTAWHGSSFDAAAKMPGSATKGFTDMITLSDESVADTIITINVRV